MRGRGTRSLSLSPIFASVGCRFSSRHVVLSGHLPRNTVQYVLLWSLIAALALTLVYPILLTVRGGLAADIATKSGWTFDHILLVFQDPTSREALLNSLMIATGTTTLACLIALPLAVLAANYKFPGKGIF